MTARRLMGTTRRQGREISPTVGGSCRASPLSGIPERFNPPGGHGEGCGQPWEPKRHGFAPKGTERARTF
jgi:hypothetical protein